MKMPPKYKNCGAVNVPSTGKLIYLILVEFANDNGEVIISQRRISDTLHISKGAVGRNLRRLRDGSYIYIYPMHHNDGGRAANKYVLR